MARMKMYTLPPKQAAIMDKNISFMDISFWEAKVNIIHLISKRLVNKPGWEEVQETNPLKPNEYETENLDKNRCGSLGGSFALVALLGYLG